MPLDSAHPGRLSTELERLAALCREKSPTLGELLPGIAPRDQALLTAVLSVAFCHPIPLPGLSTVCGLLIAVAGCRMALGKGTWVPQRWRERPMPGARLAKVFAVGASLMHRCEKVIRPRGRWLTTRPWLTRLNGAAIAICGLLLAMPAPPGTAMPPAVAILLLSVGALEADLLFLALGYAALAFNMFFFGALARLGWGGLRALLG